MKKFGKDIRLVGLKLAMQLIKDYATECHNKDVAVNFVFNEIRKLKQDA